MYEPDANDVGLRPWLRALAARLGRRRIIFGAVAAMALVVILVAVSPGSPKLAAPAAGRAQSPSDQSSSVLKVSGEPKPSPLIPKTGRKSR